MNDPLVHTPVLLHPAVDALLPATNRARGTFVDATFGRGGHARALLSRLDTDERLLAFDKDPQALDAATALARQDARFSIRQESFAALAALQPGSIAGLLMDLGISSPQIDQAERGFSFRFDGPLDMRMDPTRGQSVAQWLASAELTHIAEVIRDFGEERFAVAIAKAIVARRESGRAVAGTTELAELVAGAVKTREPGQNPATRTFQAFRIFINAELEELQQALEASINVLQPRARLAVISFHSLEDRIVKQFIARHSRECFDRRVPFAAPPALALQAVARIRPAAQEIAANARSRSAILRVAERNADGDAEAAFAPAAQSPRPGH